MRSRRFCLIVYHFLFTLLVDGFSERLAGLRCPGRPRPGVVFKRYAPRGVQADPAWRLQGGQWQGEHPDWEEYDQAVRDDGCSAIIVVADYIYYGNAG